MAITSVYDLLLLITRSRLLLMDHSRLVLIRTLRFAMLDCRRADLQRRDRVRERVQRLTHFLSARPRQELYWWQQLHSGSHGSVHDAAAAVIDSNDTMDGDTTLLQGRVDSGNGDNPHHHVEDLVDNVHFRCEDMHVPRGMRALAKAVREEMSSASAGTASANSSSAHVQQPSSSSSSIGTESSASVATAPLLRHALPLLSSFDERDYALYDYYYGRPQDSAMYMDELIEEHDPRHPYYVGGNMRAVAAPYYHHHPYHPSAASYATTSSMAHHDRAHGPHDGYDDAMAMGDERAWQERERQRMMMIRYDEDGMVIGDDVLFSQQGHMQQGHGYYEHHMEHGHYPHGIGMSGPSPMALPPRDDAQLLAHLDKTHHFVMHHVNGGVDETGMPQPMNARATAGSRSASSGVGAPRGRKKKAVVEAAADASGTGKATAGSRSATAATNNRGKQASTSASTTKFTKSQMNALRKRLMRARDTITTLSATLAEHALVDGGYHAAIQDAHVAFAGRLAEEQASIEDASAGTDVAQELPEQSLLLMVMERNFKDAEACKRRVEETRDAWDRAALGGVERIAGVFGEQPGGKSGRAKMAKVMSAAASVQAVAAVKQDVDHESMVIDMVRASVQGAANAGPREVKDEQTSATPTIESTTMVEPATSATDTAIVDTPPTME